MSQHHEPSPPPHAQVIQMALSYWVPRAVYMCAKFDVANLLASGPRHSDDLARACGANAGAMFRLLRTAASLGLFKEVSSHTFALTPLGETLKSGAPGMARNTILAIAGPWAWASWGEVEYSFRTGKPGAEKALGMPVFDYLGRHPEQAAYFNDAMIGFHGAEPEAVAAAFDFSKFGTLVDVGGGTGNLIAAILRATPRLKGIIYDLPHVSGAARERLTALGLADRCTVIGGSFFESVPPGDAYVLSHVIHDWDEEKCLTILGNCRRANPRAPVHLVEMVIPPGDEPHPGKLLDLMMLVGPGGMERSAAEYEELLGKAGYRMTRVVPTASAVSVVEGVAK